MQQLVDTPPATPLPAATTITGATGPDLPTGRHDESLLARLPSGTGHLLLADRIDPDCRRRAEFEHLRNLQNRRRLDPMLEQLLAGQGLDPYHPQDPSGPHLCFRHDENLLQIRPHAVFLANQRLRRGELPDDTGFSLYLFDRNVIARRDGQWVEDLDQDFFDAVDAAWRGSRQAFLL